MTHYDPAPRDTSDDITESERRLHDTLVAPFERPFASLGYQAEFTFTPLNHSRIFHGGGAWEQVHAVTKLAPSAKQPWTVRLGYDPKKDGITTTAFEVPVVSPSDDTTLIFQRIRETGEYLLLQSDAADDSPRIYESPFDSLERSIVNRNSAYALSEADADAILISAGYTVPEVFTSPNDLQEHAALTFDTATRWSRKEVIAIELDDKMSIDLQRTSTVHPSSQFVEESADYTRQTDGTVTCILNYFSGDQHHQLVIQFDYTDHFVKKPVVATRRVVQAFDDAVVASYGPNAVQYIGQNNVDLSPDQMDELAEDLTLKLLG